MTSFTSRLYSKRLPKFYRDDNGLIADDVYWISHNKDFRKLTEVEFDIGSRNWVVKSEDENDN